MKKNIVTSVDTLNDGLKKFFDSEEHVDDDKCPDDAHTLAFSANNIAVRFLKIEKKMALLREYMSKAIFCAEDGNMAILEEFLEFAQETNANLNYLQENIAFFSCENANTGIDALDSNEMGIKFEEIG